jgi:hypothetical protein
MPEFSFDTPLTLKGNIVVRNLDDAVRFMIGYREALRPEFQTSVLHRLEGAAGEVEERGPETLSVVARRQTAVRATTFRNSGTAYSASLNNFT